MSVSEVPVAEAEGLHVPPEAFEGHFIALGVNLDCRICFTVDVARVKLLLCVRPCAKSSTGHRSVGDRLRSCNDIAKDNFLCID